MNGSELLELVLIVLYIVSSPSDSQGARSSWYTQRKTTCYQADGPEQALKSKGSKYHGKRYHISTQNLTVEFNNINHEGILDCKLSFSENCNLYFGMEYMAHGSISQIMKKTHPSGIKKLPVIVTILKCLLDGVSYLHQNKLFHR